MILLKQVDSSNYTAMSYLSATSTVIDKINTSCCILFSQCSGVNDHNMRPGPLLVNRPLLK